MRCPHCKDRLLQKSDGETRLRIRGAIRIDANGIVKAQCHWCREEVELPLMLKGLDTIPEDEPVRFVLKPGS